MTPTVADYLLERLRAATALLKGDANRWGVLREGLMTKAREVMPGKDS